MACLERARQRLDALVTLFTQADREIVLKAAQAAWSLENVSACADVLSLQSMSPLPSDPASLAKAEEIRRQLAQAAAMSAAGKLKEGAAVAGTAAGLAGELGHAGLRAEALLLQGRINTELGEPKLAEQLLHGAALAATSARDDVQLVKAWGLLSGVVGYKQGRTAEGRRWAEYAQAVLPRATSDSGMQADVLNALAKIDFMEGHYAESLALFERALPLRRAALGPDHLEVARAENNVAVLLVELGRSEEGRAHHERALAILRAVHGPEHPSVADSMDNLGIVLTDLRQWEEAERLLREALQLREKALGKVNSEVGRSLNNLGRMLNMSGRPKEAREVFQRALEVSAATDGPQHPMSAWVFANLGAASRTLGDYRRAVEEYRKGYEIIEKSSEGKHQDLAIYLVGLSDAHYHLKQADLALQEIERAGALYKAGEAPDHQLAEQRFLNAQLLRSLRQDPKRQKALAEEARSLYEKSGKGFVKEMKEVEAWMARAAW